jgi:lipoprotein-anchoring transpeptidase ErfK/SrfK
MMPTRIYRLLAVTLALFFAACARDTVHTMVVSVPDQKLALYRKGELVHLYDVSTSKFCVSTRNGSYGTPLGKHEIAKKIGDGQPQGMKFSSRRPTGEIVPPNAPGRDPIVSRILWLSGKEPTNRNSYQRCIYIHGTPEESRIGTPASYGCIRMRSRDVVDLYRAVGVGAKVEIVNEPLAIPSLHPPVEVSGAQVAQVTGHEHASQ